MRPKGVRIMITRKTERELLKFYKDNGRYALLVDGARQVGKTFIIESFARTHYKSFLKIDFIRTPDARAIFQDVADEGEILVRLSALSERPLVKGETLIFLDEIEKCPEAVTYVKYLVQEGSYRYILSGSLLGVEMKDIRSVPVGFMDEVKMFPLDFEEFVQALMPNAALLDEARKAWNEVRPLARALHEKLRRLFRLYLVVGGMPEAVQTYVDTKDIRRVIDVQSKILKEYRRDIAQYDEANSLRIREVFDRLAPELNGKNKRFHADSVAEVGRFDRLENEFVWLKAAGVALPACNVTEPKVPLTLATKPNFFKLFMNDVGLLAAQYMNGIQLKILNGETDVNFGAVFENFVAQELVAHGFEPRYYNSSRHGEVDFVVERDGVVVPLEVKSGKHYARHSALSHLLADAEYDLPKAYVFNDDVWKSTDRILYLPVYMVDFFRPTPLPEKMIYDISDEEK